MHKIRSIQVVNVRWFNATAWYGLYLSKLLREAGHETLVIGLDGTRSFEQAKAWELDPMPVRMNTNSPAELVRLYGKLGKIVDDFKPDVVDCHRGESFFLWAMLKKNKNFALVRTRGDQRLPRRGRINQLLHQRCADALIATNSRTARAFIQRLRVDPSKIFTILGGVDTSRFYPDKAAGLELRQKLGFGADDFVIGLLGRLDPVKGHEVVINALGEIRKTRPGCKLQFLCIGMPSGLSIADISRMAEAAGVADRVTVTGIVDNVRAYINALDLGVLASVGSEAIARAALEIMACGIPLLSSDIGVMPDLLPEEVLVPANSCSLLATEILRALDEPEYLASLRELGKTAMLDLGPENFLGHTLDAYRAALDWRGISS